MDLLFVVLVAHVTSVLFRQFLQILGTMGGKKKEQNEFMKKMKEKEKMTRKELKQEKRGRE